MRELRTVELGINRQGECFQGGAFRLRKIARLVPQVLKALLQMQRDRIIDLRANAAPGEKRAQLIAPLAADHILIENVPPARRRFRGPEFARKSRPCKRRTVERGVTPPPLGPAVEIAELDPQHRGLQFIDAEIAADQRVVILRLAAMHP